MKIAMIFPYAPVYRGPIYELMDKELDIDWYFCGNAQRPLRLYDYTRLKKVGLSLKEKTLLGSIVYFEGIKKLNLDEYDAIIVPSVIRNLSMWWLMKKYAGGKRGPKLYYWTHGWYGREGCFSSIIKDIFYKPVDGFFLYNTRAKELMLKRGYESAKLHVIYNSLDYDCQLPLRKSMKASGLYHEHFGNDNPNIVFIGRLTKIKRFDLLVDAVFDLKNRGKLVNVTFIGDGAERKWIESRIIGLAIQNQVWFYGECYNEKTNAEMIYNADICVSPGNVGLTAMHVLMFGCPVITNDDYEHQGPEFEAIEEGKSGTFFKAGDSQSLADTISRWLTEHKKDREQVRQACYKVIDEVWNPHNQLKVLKEALSKIEYASK